MRSIDAMPRAYRELVHEFGYTIVRDMREYVTSPTNMLHTLQGWRARRQAEWLDTVFVRPRRLRF